MSGLRNRLVDKNSHYIFPSETPRIIELEDKAVGTKDRDISNTQTQGPVNSFMAALQKKYQTSPQETYFGSLMGAGSDIGEMPMGGQQNRAWTPYGTRMENGLLQENVFTCGASGNLNDYFSRIGVNPTNSQYHQRPNFSFNGAPNSANWQQPNY